jgi:hypothetical protein
MLIVNELLVDVASTRKCLSNAGIENIPSEGLFSCLENRDYYPQKLALTLPTGGSRSVGIVRSWTKATELVRRYILF